MDTHKHAEAICTIEKIQDAITNRDTQYLLGKVLISLSSERDRLMGEIEESVKTGTVRLSDVLWSFRSHWQHNQAAKVVSEGE